MRTLSRRLIVSYLPFIPSSSPTSAITQPWNCCSVISTDPFSPSIVSTWLIATPVFPAAQWSSGCDSSSPYKLYWGKIWVLSSHYIFKIIIHPLSHSNPTPLRHTHLAFMTWSFCHCYLSLDHSPLFIKHFGIRLTFFSRLQFLPSL